MTHDNNDPRLTAYALDEMDPLDDSERREVEDLLASDAAARAEVDELREIAALLTRELASEDDSGEAPRLDEQAQSAIEAHAAQVTERAEQLRTQAPDDGAQVLALSPHRRARRRVVFAGVALAATVLIGLAIFPLMKSPRDRRGFADFTVSGPQSAKPTTLARGNETETDRSRAVRTFDNASKRARNERLTPGSYRTRLGDEENGARLALRGPRGDRDGTDTGVHRGLAANQDPSSVTTTKSEKDAWHRRRRLRRAAQRFQLAARAPLSTFSVDVDTAAYANVRRYLSRSVLPPHDVVRVEEMINYFPYDYAEPTGSHPLGVHVEVASAPWNARHRLVRVALAAKSMRSSKRPPSNLVFLIDVSGSMSSDNKLPLLRRSLAMLVRRLGEKDRVAIVVYAGASGLVLRSTSCAAGSRKRVLSALERLGAGGSTNGGEGIELAYRIAVRNYITGGVNRVVLATDGDFNVGLTSQQALVQMIKEKAKSGVYLSVLGFGMSRGSDHTLEQIADKGNGHYAYIDTIAEARKVLVDEINSTLVTVAKDVKIQVEFNPARVMAYRLIGYANRRLAARDFNNDKKDAGEVGAGHRVTALYEVVPVGLGVTLPGVDKLKYAPRVVSKNASKELLTVKVRYKRPRHEQSTLMTKVLVDDGARFRAASNEFRFAAAVGWFGESLAGSAHVRRAPYEQIIAVARAARGSDRFGYRAEMIKLVFRAAALRRAPVPTAAE